MKLPRGLVASVFALALLSPARPGQAAPPDFSLIEKLPEREIAAKKIAHEGWDTGVTAKMLAATDAYNDALTGMINDLAAAYYGKGKLTREEIAVYVKTLQAAAAFRHKLDNPTNEDRGTLDALEAPSVVSNDLEETVAQMAEAVTEDNDKFAYPAWEKRWNAARKTGDVDPAAAPASQAAPSPAKPGKPE